MNSFQNPRALLPPPMTFINLSLGAQDVSSHSEGSFTGQISAKQLLRVTDRLKYCIVGHSELRHKGDSNFLVREKSLQLINNNIEPILCIGEDKESLLKGERESGKRKNTPDLQWCIIL